MGNFFSALGHIATNESAYRNAIISAVVLLFAASGELIAEKAGTHQHLARGDDARRSVQRGGRCRHHSLDVGRTAVRGRRRAAGLRRAGQHEPPPTRPISSSSAWCSTCLVLGLVGYLTGAINPKSQVVGRLSIPLVSRIPLLGPALFDQPWVLYLVYPLVPLVWWLLYRTRWGLEVRAIGEDPNAADVSGLHVNRLRRQTIYLTGLLAGVGGGYFLFARSGRFEDSLIGGRGYIAIAAVIFGGWTLKGTVAGCITFGLVGSFVLTIPSLGYKSIDSSFLVDRSQRRDRRGDGGVRQTGPPAGGPRPTVHPRSAMKAVLYDRPGGSGGAAVRRRAPTRCRAAPMWSCVLRRAR